MVRTLIVSSQPVVDGTVLSKLLQGGITTLDDISFVTNSRALPAQSLPEAVYSVAFSLAEDAGAHDSQLLAELFRALKHSGTLTIIERDHKVSSGPIRYSESRFICLNRNACFVPASL